MSRNPPEIRAVSGAPFRIGVVAARYNGRFADGLLERTLAGLRAAGVKEGNLAVLRVPGSGELPIAVQGLAARTRPHALIALGVIVRGDTAHFEILAESVARTLKSVALESRTPVIDGVVVARSPAQAAARCLGRIDRGAEFARAAVAMAALKKGGWR